MLPRFYAPDLDPASPFVTLPADEARHLTRVLRLAAGDEVSVFDGRGTEFRASVDVAVRDTARLRLLGRAEVPPPPRVQTTIVQAVLKGASMDDAVRDATMLGVVSIEPVLTAYTDVKPSFVSRPETVERWKRIALASAKQSRRATLPQVHAPRTLEEWIVSHPIQSRLLFVEPSARCEPKALKSLMDQPPDRVAVLLGPEGGWSPVELETAIGAGCIPVTLGHLTLRAESMPVAALASLAAVWGT